MGDVSPVYGDLEVVIIRVDYYGLPKECQVFSVWVPTNCVNRINTTGKELFMQNVRQSGTESAHFLTAESSSETMRRSHGCPAESSVVLDFLMEYCILMSTVTCCCI